MARRRFQASSPYKNKTKTLWKGSFSKYILDSNGTERRKRTEITLGPGTMTKRQAQHILQPYIDEVNASIGKPLRADISFRTLVSFWRENYLVLSKRSTQATMRGHTNQLDDFFGEKLVRQINAADLQRFVSNLQGKEYSPKTIRNMWVTLRLILGAGVTLGYIDQIPQRPKLSRIIRGIPRFFNLEEVAKIIVGSEYRLWLTVVLWLAAETGLRAGELCALRLVDVDRESITVNQSVWNHQISTPKTKGSVRKIAISEQLSALLQGLIKEQQTNGCDFMFSGTKGYCYDPNWLRSRWLRPLLRSIGILRAGLHAFRHFNASLLVSLGVPLKTIQERLGHASTGSLTLDVYTHAEWSQNVEAAQLIGNAIQKAVDSVRLTPGEKKGLPPVETEALCVSE